MTALELWCFSCIIFTFSSLLSYVTILLKMKMRENNAVDSKHAVKVGCAKEEKILFVVNLCCFVIFNICFWYIYVIKSIII